MLILVLSGDVNNDVIDSVFEEVGSTEVKNEFLRALEEHCRDMKIQQKDKPVVSPSEYRP